MEQLDTQNLDKKIKQKCYWANCQKMIFGESCYYHKKTVLDDTKERCKKIYYSKKQQLITLQQENEQLKCQINELKKQLQLNLKEK